MKRFRVAAAFLVLALGTAVAVARAGATFPDPVGDVRGGSGPDLTSISVSHTSTAVTLSLRFAKAPPLQGPTAKAVDVLLIGIDVPPRSLRRHARGWTGVDYWLGTHGTLRTATVTKVGGQEPSAGSVVARPKVVIDGRTLSFSLARRKLGSPAWFDFAVAVGREEEGGGNDYAPARGAFRYTLTG